MHGHRQAVRRRPRCPPVPRSGRAASGGPGRAGRARGSPRLLGGHGVAPPGDDEDLLVALLRPGVLPTAERLRQGAWEALKRRLIDARTEAALQAELGDDAPATATAPATAPATAMTGSPARGPHARGPRLSEHERR